MQQDTIDELLVRLQDAWADGDADAYAAQFTDDASYVIYVGLVYLGRQAIRDAHVPVFEKWQRGTRMSMRVLDRRFVTEDLAVVTTEGGIGKGTVTHDKLQTFVLVRTGEGWRCCAFQNTKKNRLFIAVNRLADRRVAAADREK